MSSESKETDSGQSKEDPRSAKGMGAKKESVVDLNEWESLMDPHTKTVYYKNKRTKEISPFDPRRKKFLKKQMTFGVNKKSLALGALGPKGSSFNNSKRNTSIRRVSEDERDDNQEDTCLNCCSDPELEQSTFRKIPVFFTFEDIHYEVHQGAEDEIKTIIKQASGFCAPGTMTAIMGPSGAGKTSLLNVLAGRQRGGVCSGEIMLNGERVHEKSFVRLSGYVMQHDHLIETLTVRETLMFAANMKMSTSITRKDKIARVESIIKLLGLSHVADTWVGGDKIPGLSGGERRRVSTGIQLCAMSSLLFLDEPTSGLDAHTAHNLIASLRKMADDSLEPMTIICTIHQPNRELFAMFDNLVLLSAGHCVYSGPRKGAYPFFESIGYKCPDAWNPADYFLNVVNVVRKSDAQKKAEAKNSGRENDEGKDGLDDEDFEWGPNMASIMRLGSNVAEYVHPTHHVAKHGDNLKKAAEQRAKDQMERFRNWHNTHGKKHHGKEAADDTLTEDDLPWLCESFYTSKNGARLVKILKEERELREARHKERMKVAAELAGKNFTELLAGKPQASRGKSGSDDLNEQLKEQSSGGILLPSFGDQSEFNEVVDVEQAVHDEYPLTFWQQTRLLVYRNAVQTWRNPMVVRIMVIQYFVLAILLGTLYSDLSESKRAYSISMVIMLIQATLAMTTSANAVGNCFAESLVYNREVADGTYRPAAYALASTLISIPIQAILSTVIVCISYKWIGLTGPGPTLDSNFGLGERFLKFLLINFVFLAVFDAASQFFGHTGGSLEAAYAVANSYTAVAGLFCGTFIPYSEFPAYYKWLYWISPYSYAYAAAAVNEYTGTEDSSWLDLMGLPDFTSNYWADIAVLVCFFIAFRCATLVVMQGAIQHH